MNGLLVLAGGKGTRMKSKEPKVLVPFRGEPMLQFTMKNIARFFPKPYILIGHRGEEIRERLGSTLYNYIVQEPSLGTGHAVQCAKKELAAKDFQNIVIFPGDHPLLTPETLQKMIDLHEAENAVLTLVTARIPNYQGPYKSFSEHGRIVRDRKGNIERIVEAKDCTPEQRKITELNAGIYCFKSDWLWENIGKLNNKNAAGEYLLTDMIGLTTKKTGRIASFTFANPFEGLGANTPEELQILQRFSLEETTL